MNGNLEPNQFEGPLLPMVVAVIVVSLGALAWEWREAHTPAANPDPPTNLPNDKYTRPTIPL